MHNHQQGRAILTGVIVLLLPACGGGGGEAGTTSPNENNTTDNPTIHIIDAYEVPSWASDLYQVLAAPIHQESRSGLADKVPAGSNAQSSNGKGVTVSLVRNNGKLLNPDGSFSLSSSYGWHSVEGPCPCSIHTRAWFFDEGGYELLSWDSEPNTRRLPSSLYASAKHDVVQGMWYQEGSVFGVFSDGTRPTGALRSSGSALYVGSIYGMLVPSAGSAQHLDAVAALTLSVAWDTTPTLSGIAGGLHVDEISIGSLGTMSQRTLASTIDFSGGEWSEKHKAFHNGSIGCRGGCGSVSDSKGLWNAHFVDTGSDSVDPFMLSGTFGLYKYLFGETEYDFIGFIHGTKRPVTTYIIDAYEVPRRASDLYRELAASVRNESRANLAASVHAGSNTQSSHGSVVTVSLVRNNGKSLNPDGSFSLWNSHGWHEVDGPCPCSIHTRAWFYDEDGHELLSRDSDPSISSLSLAVLASAKHDVVQGMWYQDDGVFGVFSDGTRPTAALRSSGTARYVGSIYGMLVPSTGSTQHHDAVAALTLSVGWGTTPSLSGRAGAIHAYELSIDARGTLTSTLSQKTLASTIEFSGGMWSDEHKAFHNGSIGCLGGCVPAADAKGLWNAHFVDTGTVSVDPFMLSGTFGLYKYLFEGDEYDFIGFIMGTKRPVTTYIIDAYEEPSWASDLYQVLAAPSHQASRSRLADKVHAGSNAQSSGVGVVTVSLVRNNGKLLNPDGSFSLWSSDGWHDGDGTCPCSIHTRAWFYDEDGRELLSRDSDPSTSSSLFTSLYASAKHDVIQGMWYQDDGVFGVFSDGTRPTADLRTSGSARYVGSVYGMLVPSTGSTQHHDAVAALTLSVAWDTTPSISGRAGNIHANEISIGALGEMTSTLSQKTLASTITFSGGVWSEVHKAFHNGSIGCLGGCVPAADAKGLWHAHFVDTGTVSVDPFMLSGTFGLYKYLFGGQAYDFIGFIMGTKRPVTTYIIDAYEVPGRASDLYQVLAAPSHQVSRSRLADKVHVGSNAQSSDGSVVTVSLVRNNGKLLNLYGSFSLWNSHGWHDVDGNCPCSIYTRARFYDEMGLELLAWDSHPTISSLSLALLVSAQHDVVQGMWYQEDGVFGVFSDGTRPTADLRTSGSARYVGSVYGMLVPSTGSVQHHEAVAALTLSVAWGTAPSISGRAGNIHANEISIGSLGEMTSTLSQKTLASTIVFSGGEWSDEHKAFHNGSIGCAGGCGTVSDTKGVWNAHFVDTGTVSVDPFMLSGTFGLYKYLFKGNEYDFIGFIMGTKRPVTTHIIDAYEEPGRASDLYQVLAAPSHQASRSRLADKVYVGSNAQSSHGSVVTVSLVRNNGKSLNPDGSFSLWNSHGWHEVDGPCPCSIHTRAWFYDEDGRELLSRDSDPSISSLSLAVLASAKHDVVQGMWYQDDGVFGVFSDGTRPTAALRTSGSARYVGSVYGMLVPSTGSTQHHDAVAALTLSVAWDTTPSISGRAGNIHANEISIGALGEMTSTLSQKTLASTITFSGGVWSDEHKAFHNGSIGCLGGCVPAADAKGLWNAHFVDTGTVSVDPFMLSGTFGLYKYLFGENEYDFIGFIHGTKPAVTTPPTPPAPAENPTIHIIDAYEVPRLASNLYRVLAASGHNDSRKRLAHSVMHAGSNGQRSDGGVITVSLARTNGNLLGPSSSFSLSSSYGWWREGAGPCRCSIYTRALFYDEYGYELFSLVSHPNTISVSNPLYASAKHGVVQGMWYQEDGGFGVFSDGTRPTAALRSWGSARYVGSIYGMLAPSTGSAHHHEAVAALTLSVFWGTTPSLYGRAGHLHAHELSIDALGEMTSTLSHMTLASTIAFSGGEWSEEHKAFHNGSIGCLGCGTGTDAKGVWNAHFVDTGSGGVDPFILSGTFGLYQYQLGEQAYDLIGFIHGYTPLGASPLIRRGYGTTRYSSELALANKLVYNIFNNRHLNQGKHGFTTLEVSVRQDIIKSAASIASPYSAGFNGEKNHLAAPMYYIPGVTTAYPEYNRSTVYGWMEISFERDLSRPYLTGNALRTVGQGNGSAAYSGLAGGYYTSESRSGAFVSTIEVGVQFKTTGHEASWKMGYDFDGVTGTLTMTDGEWDYLGGKGFSNGSVQCASGCNTVGTLASWSAAFFNSRSPLHGDGWPGGFAGKFGAASISHDAVGEAFDAVGVFTAFSNQSIFALPTDRTNFPARLVDILTVSSYNDDRINALISEDNLYQRNLLASVLYNSTVQHPANKFEVEKPTLRMVGGKFIDAGGTIHLSTPSWDWRTGDSANCYCTMFLTGGVFGSDGMQLPLGLSASPTLLTGKRSFAGVHSGWVGGVWIRHHVPDIWHQFGGSQMGIFVDGTAPATLPQSGTMKYTGQAFAVASVPADHDWFYEDDFKDGHEVLEGEVSLDVTWGYAKPTISGRLQLYRDNTNETALKVDLLNATWSWPKSRHESGLIKCTSSCTWAPRHIVGAWESMFVATGGTITNPGLVAGVFALDSILLGVLEEADVFGWFSAQPSGDLSEKNRLLNAPLYSAHLAYQQGFASLFVNASPELRNNAVTVDVAPGFHTKYKHHHGYFSLRPRDEYDRFMYTSFWFASSQTTTLSLGLSHLASPVSVPITGNAEYAGNAAGIYASSAGKEGVFQGDVTLSLQFATDGVDATGKLYLDFSGTASSFDMSLDDKFTDHVRDGTLVCATGCNGGTLKWGGSMLHTEDTQEPGEIPDGFFGQIKMQGVTMDSTITYDALGMFAAVKE